MKFQVRAGYVIHDTRIVTIGDKRVEQTSSYYEGEQADFDEDTAMNHLHKLEPADKASEKFLAARAQLVSPPATGIDPVMLQQLISQAVAAAVAGVAAAQKPAS